MNLAQLNELDFKTLGQWPLPVKAFFAALTAVVVALLILSLLLMALRVIWRA